MSSQKKRNDGLGKHEIEIIYIYNVNGEDTNDSLKAREEFQKNIAHLGRCKQINTDLIKDNCLNQAKAYFEKKPDECIVQYNKRYVDQVHPDKRDFTVVNLTKGYILVICTEANDVVLANGRNRSFNAIYDVFIEEQCQNWKYIGVLCVDKSDSSVLTGKQKKCKNKFLLETLLHLNNNIFFIIPFILFCSSHLIAIIEINICIHVTRIGSKNQACSIVLYFLEFDR